MNSYLVKKLTELDKYFIESRINHGVLTFDNIKVEFFRKSSIKTLNEFYQEFINNNRFDASRTKQVYKTTKATMDEYDKSVDIQAISENIFLIFIVWECTKKNLKDVTINKHLTYIKTVIKEIVRAGLLTGNPLGNAKFKLKPEKAVRTSLTVNEVKKYGCLLSMMKTNI